MKLFEFEAKNILQKYGIETPRGNTASNPDETELIAREIGKPVALKSQVLVSSRGKSGGIMFAGDATEAKKAASKLIGIKVRGATVSSVLVEEKIDIADEFYTSVAIDRVAKKYAVLASTSGGIDIEQIAQDSPDKIAFHRVDPLTGFSEHAAEAMVAQFPNMDKDDASRVSTIIHTLYGIAMDYDAELVEINPLVKTTSGKFMACDARIIVDDNALYRHTEFEGRGSLRADDTSLEARAREQKLAYVDLDGDIGIIGNGAGLTLATLDLVHFSGGKPANFLDVGAARAETYKRAVALVMSKPQVRAVLVNIFGGVTRCEVVAQGIVEALNESTEKKPIAVRMIGTNAEEGHQMLRQAGVNTYFNTEEAIREILRPQASHEHHNR